MTENEKFTLESLIIITKGLISVVSDLAAKSHLMSKHLPSLDTEEHRYLSEIQDEHKKTLMILKTHLHHLEHSLKQDS